MRLIDADAYSAEMRERQDEAFKWKEIAKKQYDQETYHRALGAIATFVEAKLTLDNMPTIDAADAIEHLMRVGWEYGAYKEAAEETIKDLEKSVAEKQKRIEELEQIANHHEQTAKDYWKQACEYKEQLPKHGEWKKKYDSRNWYHWYVCSECGNRPLKDIEGFSVLSDFCPSCGAKMGVQE